MPENFPDLPIPINSLSNRLGGIIVDAFPSWMIKRTDELIKESHVLEYAKPGQLWLDAGTGKGFIPQLLNKLGIKTVSFDNFDIPSPKMMQDIRGSFAIADIQHPPIANNSLDGATAYFVLHHIPKENHPQIIKNIFNKLKPGATFILVEDKKPQTKKQTFITNLNDKLLNLLNVEISDEHSFRTASEWRELFEQEGFRTIEQRAFSRSDLGVKISHPIFVFQKPTP